MVCADAVDRLDTGGELAAFIAESAMVCRRATDTASVRSNGVFTHPRVQPLHGSRPPGCRAVHRVCDEFVPLDVLAAGAPMRWGNPWIDN